MSKAVNISILPSGVKIVTERMEHVETLSLGAYVNAGTRYEESCENGISHFLEHMAFKGTEKRSAFEIAETIENVGGHINAYTAREITAYYLKLLKEDLELGVDILGDILTHSTFNPEEIEKERSVILQEIGQTNDTPDDIIFDYFQDTAYPNQPMGRPTLGTHAIINTLNRNHLKEYVNNHYISSNIIFSAAGNVKHDQIVSMVERYFKDLPQGNKISPLPAAYQGGEFRKEKELDQAHIVLGFPSVNYKHTLYYPAVLLSIILGGGMSSRLFQEIREKRGLVYSIYSYNNTHLDDGVLGIYAGTGKKQTKELLSVLIEELKKVQHFIKPEELKRTKAQLKSSLLMSMESTASRCEQIARHLQIYGRVIPAHEIVKKIDAVELEDIYNIAAQIFHSKPTLATLGPIQHVPSLSFIAERLSS
ncbi:putative zinc protease [Commensalibacter sp. Nvir]|uniref:M16 family metallopeptidase n=1 Tax=Commensalibacter sp. Nvir TaxID=3069817 RepID=UPI002D583EDD|nr:putative zinc protease [Commensalibacter sp. Nvir]